MLTVLLADGTCNCTNAADQNQHNSTREEILEEPSEYFMEVFNKKLEEEKKYKLSRFSRSAFQQTSSKHLLRYNAIK